MIICTARIAPCSQSDGRAAVRNARPILDLGDEWLETIAAGGFLPLDGRQASVLNRHDGSEVGFVSALAAGRDWWEADLVLDDAARDLAVVGAPVSIDAQSLARTDNQLSGTRRHTLVRLQHICFVAARERPGYGPGARITHVHSSSPAPVAGSTSAARHAAGEIVHRGDEILRRYFPAEIAIG